MTRPSLPASLPPVAAALVLVVLVPLALLLTGGSAQAAGLSGAAGYSCQYSGVESSVVPDDLAAPGVGGLPVPVVPSVGGSDDVTVAVALDAPARVAPGGTLRLRGTATFTFGPNATATNASTVFAFLSDSFGVTIASGSGPGATERFVRIERLVTSRSTPGEPVVRARFALPDYLVPGDATGRVSLALPEEAVVTNPVSTSPEAVAFTGLLRTDSRLQPQRTVACALLPDQRTGLGSVPVRGATQAPPTTGGEPSGAPTTPPSTSPGTSPAPGSATGTRTTGTSTPPGGTAPSAAPGATPVTAATQDGTSGASVPVTLAADPIPPATVADGVGLPPWALLLVGAFLAGGVLTAVSSQRRLRQAGLGAAGVLAAGLLVVVPTPLVPQTPAEAATGQAQVTLACVYQAEGSAEDTRARSQPTGLSITLDVPDSVAPGDVVSLTGSASVQAPEDIRSQAAQLGYNKLDAISDAFSVGLRIGSSARQVFLADRWQTGKTAFSNPLVVRGPLSFPAFKVPEGASGSIAIELPRNEVLDRRPKPYSNADTPPRVAMEFLATATGNGTAANYIVSCWRTDDGAGTIATIPVARDAAPGSGTPSAPAAGGGSGAGSGTGQPAAPAGQDPTSAGSAPGGTGTGSAPSTAPAAGAVPGGSATPGSTATPGATQGAAAPLLQGATATSAPALVTQPASGEVVVPTWLLVLTVLLGLAAYGFAGWNRLRLRDSGTRRDS